MAVCSSASGAAPRRDEEGERRRVALIAGVTGVVGASLAALLVSGRAGGGNWKVYGVSRRPLPAWMDDVAAIRHIVCDLLDAHQSSAALSSLDDVTHLFYVTWTSRPTEQENCVANTTMLKNTLEPLLSSCKGLQHVCLQTGIKHYIGSHMAYAPTTSPIFIESAPRLGDLNFYYAQEDYLLDALGSSNPATNVSWSIHRPGLIFGLSTNSFVNVLYALGVYASICKHENSPFIFPGTKATWHSHLNASDADLVAEQQVWAAMHVEAHKQAFNVSNGDNVTWKEMWTLLSQSFAIQPKSYLQKPQSFAQLMEGKIEIWQEMVQQYGLFPSNLAHFIAGWQVLDAVFQKMPKGKSSMQKSKDFGFFNSRDTGESLLYWVNKMREKKLVL